MAADSRFFGRTSLNLLTSVLRTVVMAVIGLFLIPYYLGSLGQATYAIIPLATTITSYVGIITDSLGMACSRYSTIAIHEQADASATISTALFGIGRMSIILLPIVLLISLAVPAIFDIGGNSGTEVSLMFFLILVSSLIFALSSAFISVFNAFNKGYLNFMGRLLHSVIQAGMVLVLFTVSTPSLFHVAISYMTAAVVLLMFSYYSAKRTYPVMHLSPRDYDKALFSKMGTLGAGAIALKVGDLLFLSASLVIVNLAFGSVAQAGFAIVVTMVSMVHTACYALTSPIEPLTYECYVAGDSGRMSRMMCGAVKLVSLFMAMPIAFLIVFSPSVLSAWVGSDYVYLSTILAVALLADLFFCAGTVLPDVPAVYLKMSTLARYTLFFGAVNVVLGSAIAFLTDFGVVGVTAVYSCCMVGYVIVVMLFDANLMSSPRFSIIRSIIPGIILCVICVAAYSALSTVLTIPGRWLFVIPAALVLLLVHCVIMCFFLSADEKKQMLMMVPQSLQGVFSKLLRV